MNGLWWVPKEQIEAFVVVNKSTKYYQWLKNHPQEISLYKIGRNFEYATMKKLRKHGFYCVRKFGSKGFEDIIAIRRTEILSRYNEKLSFGEVLFVQCKYSRYQDTFPKNFDLEGLIKLAEKYGALAIFAGVRKRRMYFAQYKPQKGWIEWNPN